MFLNSSFILLNLLRSVLLAQMEIRNLEAQAPFTTADGSIIRSILDRSNAPVQNQSLAEATLAAGQSTQRHHHKQTEEIYFILDGRGEIEVDGDRREVGPGDAILCRPAPLTSFGLRRHCAFSAPARRPIRTRTPISSSAFLRKPTTQSFEPARPPPPSCSHIVSFPNPARKARQCQPRKNSPLPPPPPPPLLPPISPLQMFWQPPPPSWGRHHIPHRFGMGERRAARRNALAPQHSPGNGSKHSVGQAAYCLCHNRTSPVFRLLELVIEVDPALTRVLDSALAADGMR